jgi:hypothetical protein
MWEMGARRRGVLAVWGVVVSRNAALSKRIGASVRVSVGVRVKRWLPGQRACCASPYRPLFVCPGLINTRIPSRLFKLYCYASSTRSNPHSTDDAFPEQRERCASGSAGGQGESKNTWPVQAHREDTLQDPTERRKWHRYGNAQGRKEELICWQRTGSLRHSSW